MLMIREALARVRDRQEGATAVEYAIMVALIAAVIIVAVVALGDNASSTFQCTADSVQDQTDACGDGAAEPETAPSVDTITS